MADIKVDDLIEDIHARCGDTKHSKEESAEAYEEISFACHTSAEALREEMKAEGGGDDG